MKEEKIQSLFARLASLDTIRARLRALPLNPLYVRAVIVQKISLTPKVVVVDVTILKMARKPVKLRKKNSAGCAGEGKQRKGRFKDNRQLHYVRKKESRVESVR